MDPSGQWTILRAEPHGRRPHDVIGYELVTLGSTKGSRSSGTRGHPVCVRRVTFEIPRLLTSCPTPLRHFQLLTLAQILSNVGCSNDSWFRALNGLGMRTRMLPDTAPPVYKF